MNKLKFLEINKLVRELDWIKSELEWKSELINSENNKFFESVTFFLENHPHLKMVWENHNEIKTESEKLNFENTVEEVVKSDILQEENENENDSDIDNKIKNLYRQIVKLTHPDKIGTEAFNSIYSEATSAYKEGDIFSIVKICDSLGIDYELSENDVEIIKSEIQKIKNRLNFLETTYTYQWLKTNIVEDRNKIILAYIKKQLVK